MSKLMPAALLFGTLTAGWEVSVHTLKLPTYLLPAPSAILMHFSSNGDLLLGHTGVTALEAGLGFVLGSLFGVLLAVFFVHFRPVEMAVYPYTIALKTVPIIAIAPLLVVWFGNGILPKVLVSAIISFFPVVVNTTKGLRNIEPEAQDLFQIMSASRWQVLLRMRVPASLPFLFAALRVSATLSVIGAIVGEFSGADEGLGYFIMVSSYRLQTVEMFQGIVMSSLLGISFFYLISALEWLSVPWDRGRVSEAF